MFRKFSEIEQYVLRKNISKRVALACAHDEDALSAVVNARRKGIITAQLIGDEPRIRELLCELGESLDHYEIINEADEHAAAARAVANVADGAADIPMKGLLHTSAFLRAVLDKSAGFVREGALLSQATVMEFPQQERMLIVDDCAINIAPSVEEKVKMINDCVPLARMLGIERPRVALVSAVEVENPKIQSTVEARIISELPFEGCVVAGPFGFDNAISQEAARHKGMSGPVAGKADILIMPDLCSGNIMIKALLYFASLKSAGYLCGAARPVIMTSRTDTAENKYNTILLAVLRAASGE